MLCYVIPGPRRREDQAAGDDARWLNPLLQISDWQIASHSGGPSQGGTRFAPTALSTVHIAEGSETYLAPELTAAAPDPIALDVYGLGMLTYLLVTGQAPASSQAELLSRLEADEGLRPSALVDGLSEDIDELVQAATAYQPPRRLATADEFLEMLELVEETLTAPVSPPPAETPSEGTAKDPLEAVAGDVLAGRWEVMRRLGTGSTSRAFLVRGLQAEPTARGLAVLKVALSVGRGEILVREAEVMRRLRPTSASSGWSSPSR